VGRKEKKRKPNQTKPYKTNQNERHCTTTIHIATRCNVASEATQRGKLGTDPEASRVKLRREARWYQQEASVIGTDGYGADRQGEEAREHVQAEQQ
jgi:hypothetical protein